MIYILEYHENDRCNLIMGMTFPITFSTMELVCKFIIDLYISYKERKGEYSFSHSSLRCWLTYHNPVTIYECGIDNFKTKKYLSNDIFLIIVNQYPDKIAKLELLGYKVNF